MNHIEMRVYPEQQYREIGALEAWNTLLDIHNSMVYGFVQNRLPEPGREIDVAEAEDHVANVEKEWDAEAKGRDPAKQWSGSPPFTQMPINAKLYLHSVLRDSWQDWEKNKRRLPYSENDYVYM